MKYKTVPRRIRTRKLDRTVAKNVMKEAGVYHPMKHSKKVHRYFAEHWREYAQEV